MNVTKVSWIDMLSIISVIVSVVRAALALCQIAVAGIVLAAIGCVFGVVIKLVFGRANMNVRLANVAFIIGIIALSMAVVGTVLSVIIDTIFANAQI